MSVRERTAQRAVPTQGREAALTGGSIGRPDSWMGGYFFGSQVSAVGYRVRVRDLNLYLALNTCTLDLTAETWDLK